MKILLISSFLPFPLYSGGHIRLFNIIKNLSEHHEIILVCEMREHQTEKDINEIKRFCENVITFKRRKQWSLENIIKTTFSREPFLIVGHTNKPMKNKIKELISKNNYDAIHAETFYIMQNIPETRIPIVLTEHNIEYLVYKRYADLVPGIFKFLFYADVWKLKRRERFFWLKASRIVAVSPEEKEIIGYKNVSVVPNGVDVAKFKIQKLKFKANPDKKILFIGDFKWMQNVDSAKWILEKIWPKIIFGKSSNPKLKLWIVGKNIPNSIKKLADGRKNIILDGDNRQETPEIFSKADVLLAPIRIGGGTSYKILEAMASGVPVVTTGLGIEGIDAKNKEEVLIAETAKELADRTIEVLGNETEYASVAAKARKLIEEKYDWEKIVKKLEHVYELAVDL